MLEVPASRGRSLHDGGHSEINAPSNCMQLTTNALYTINSMIILLF